MSATLAQRLVARCPFALFGALLLSGAVAAASDYPPPPGSYPVDPVPAAPPLGPAERPQAEAPPTAPSSRMLPLPDSGPTAGGDPLDATRLFGAPAQTPPAAPPAAAAPTPPYRQPQTAPRSDFSMDLQRRSPPPQGRTYQARPTAPYPGYRGYAPAGSAPPRAPSGRQVPAQPSEQPSEKPGVAASAAPDEAARQERAGAVFRPPGLSPD